MAADSAETSWDVVVIGGALSGASTALLLLRRNPRLRVLILERSPQFKRRVGESTVEISAYFLGRVLGLTEHLNERHLVKQGLRFWFANASADSIESCSETGPGYNVRFPGYQVDRAVLDEEVLARAVSSGAHLRRPVRVRDVTLSEKAPRVIQWETVDGEIERTTTRWIVDASGVAAVLARKNGWLEANEAHPIASVWSRWSGVKNWDAPELAARFPRYARRTKAVRYTATNHFIGRGWWAWCIPLKGGDTSVGVVFDQRMVELPEGGPLGDRLRAMLLQHPAAREILADATWHEGDVAYRRNLAYRSRRFAGPGFVLVGDAAAFMDPFYSPGMDWISFSSSAAAAFVDAGCRGRPMTDRIARHNQQFSRSYDRWFNAIFRDKYQYMGDYELMTTAFRLDHGLYYLGVLSAAFSGARGLEVPPFATAQSLLPARLIAFYNRRFAAMARDRWRRGTWGRHNHGRAYSFTSYQLDASLPVRVLLAALAWLRLEMTEGWRTWLPLVASTSGEVCSPRLHDQMNVARIPMPDPSSSSSSSGAPLARFPAAVQAAHASFVAHRDLEAADHVVLAVLRDHLPADSPHRVAETLPDESRLVEDLGLDSLTIAEVVFFVEDLYRVRIPQNELEQLARVGDLRRYLRVRLGSDAG